MTTHREEFEQQFSPITDDQWQWLKEFCQRNYIPDRGVMFEWDIDGNLPVYTRDYLQLLKVEQQVFFYDEHLDCVSSLVNWYEKNEESVSTLARMNPETIYFFATISPS